MTQSEALRLADLLLSENAMDCLEHSDDAAAELRRLYEENQTLRQALAQPEQEPVIHPVVHLWDCICKWASMIANDGENANLSPPDWLVDAVKAATAPPKREWVSLTAEQIFEHEWWDEETAYAVNQFLMEKNGG